MLRIAAVWHASPQKLVGALFALLLAAVMAVGSGANFNSTSANPGNIVTAGNLLHTNSKDGALILSVDKLKPGESRSSTVDITNTGDIDGVFSVSKSNLTDSSATNPFSQKVDLKIDDVTAGGGALYNGKLASMGVVSANTITPGATHQYRFTVTFPDGGPNGADNVYKSSSTSVKFNWESVNN